MSVVLPAFPSVPCHNFIVTLGDAQYKIRMVWMDRTSAWYLSLYDTEGNAIALGRRLAANWAPMAGTLRNPEGGFFYVDGQDGYKQEDLGELLQVFFFTFDEIASSATNSLVSSVEIL